MEVGKKEARQIQERQAAFTEQEAAAKNRLAAHEQEVASIKSAADRADADARPLKTRIDELQKALKQLEAVPAERRALRYHPPISKPVNAGELFFECRDNRVTFIDLEELLDQVKAELSEKREALRNQWQVIDQVGPVGPFALKYVLSRQRSDGLDAAFGNVPPLSGRGFSYGVTEWEVIPVRSERGEPASAALAASSAFRRIVDSLDTDQAVLTFFVYTDSISAFRTLRDYLTERGFLVAGRPLPMDAPIGGSPRGTKSRAQ
jgi:hypothetical protein